ncbi:unnamed protein product [Rodentolepis nana]|uniref:LisH domain-containing protein n=1 Tax=Rodentolepis nana TaxID=102285 RepID=A0A0R3TBE8_RODNA|nr:unnamed protein product [Rodentolepis nana]
MPAPPYIQSETPRKSGASLGSYTLNNEVVSLYFLALLRAYMEAQDCVELSHFPDAKQTEEAMRLEVMKRLEQNVFISFGVLYVVIHLIFIFILWFDQFLQKNMQWLECQKNRDSRVILDTHEDVLFNSHANKVAEMP